MGKQTLKVKNNCETPSQSPNQASQFKDKPWLIFNLSEKQPPIPISKLLPIGLNKLLLEP